MNSGGKPAGEPAGVHLLAADRVYLFAASPLQTVGAYPTRFTLTLHL